MRKIVDGVTYNTDTATLVASADYDNTESAGPKGEVALYQTRGGAFFLHDHEIMAYRDRSGEWQERERDTVQPMSRDEAQEWVMEGVVELYDANAFGEPPEAAAEQAPEATIYARVPLSLKSRVEVQARAESLSLNSYVIRCLERCAASPAIRSSVEPTRVNALAGFRELAPSTAQSVTRNALMGDDVPADVATNKLLR